MVALPISGDDLEHKIDLKVPRLWSKVRGEDMSWEQAKQVNKYFIWKEKYAD